MFSSLLKTPFQYTSPSRKRLSSSFYSPSAESSSTDLQSAGVSKTSAAVLQVSSVSPTRSRPRVVVLPPSPEVSNRNPLGLSYEERWNKVRSSWNQEFGVSEQDLEGKYDQEFDPAIKMSSSSSSS